MSRTRKEWADHVMAHHPELANLLKEFNQLFDARVIKLEVDGDPLATIGSELPWSSENAVVPFIKEEPKHQPLTLEEQRERSRHAKRTRRP